MDAQRQRASHSRLVSARFLWASLCHAHAVAANLVSTLHSIPTTAQKREVWGLERFRYGGKVAEATIRLVRNIRPLLVRTCRKLKCRKEEVLRNYMNTLGARWLRRQVIRYRAPVRGRGSRFENGVGRDLVGRRQWEVTRRGRQGKPHDNPGCREVSANAFRFSTRPRELSLFDLIFCVVK